MFNIAVIGATGLVGRKTLQIIEEFGLQNNNFCLFASKKSVGKKLKIGGKKYTVEFLDKNNLDKQKFDFALFCVKEDVSKIYVPNLAKRGTKVIDFSSLYRKKYPLIVPEINFIDVQNSNIICNPNCSTAESVMALNLISKKFGLESVRYSTYQAVSGAGQKALKDFNQTNPAKLKKLDYPIVSNVIPYIGQIDKDGYSGEENKMMFETKKILHLFDTKISATCIRVPVKNCHTIVIDFTTKKAATIAKLEQILTSSPGVRYSKEIFPMPMLANGQNDVFVGRLRQNRDIKNSFSMVVCADNLRKGASLNAVQILKKLIEAKNEI